MPKSIDPTLVTLVNAAVPHVAFDGWGVETFKAAIADADIDAGYARTLCPRGGTDLAIAFHQMGDAAMVDALAAADLDGMRFRDKVAEAVRLRLAVVDDKEVVRRGTTMFAMPHLAPVGAKLIWGTADAIWTALGDTSGDVNWYTKRATLSAVYGSVVLFWLGDDSEGGTATHDFIDRRIDNVMQFERTKSAVRNSPPLKPLTGLLDRLTAGIKAPRTTPRDDLPGMWRNPK
ncbi:ubiquinone biosynthesis protein COQ9 [Loktanella ponticola]|uniref:Ubiquinone biosynthesis protein COQ9 n=1 Tax=Yoonia ponticola TaxID=1524255 RepID=A0A7W9BHI5_9RHOB|nr:COQ9 family protein [Yoonia ponticola]MBB5720663.1 ubiquinone biosynthesis protein COQ9 [Yoonia ponticola]